MFNTQTTYATGTRPRTVVVRDFNGDTIPDLVVVNQISNNVSVLLGDGAGNFNPQTTYAVGTTPWFVAVEDFNADSNLDLAVIQNIAGNSIISILSGDGSGGFNPQTTYSVGYYPQVIAIEDFNVDGNPDLVVLVSSGGGDNISIFLGDGSGGFGSETTYAVGSGLTGVVVRDFNGDTIPDLALTNQSSNSVSIVLGDGFGSFGAEATYAVGSTPRAVAAEDLNGDGQLDLAVANQNSNSVSVLLGDGAGGFNPQTTYAVDNGTRMVAIGDFNADSNKDLVVANQSSNNVSVLLGDGAGNFNPQTTYAVGSFPTSVAVEDFNGDGQLDLAVANFGGNSVSILLNTPGVSITPGTTPTEAGLVNGTFNITLDRPTPAGGLTVNFNLTGSTATATDDYELTAGTNLTAVGTNTFTIAAGVTTATLNLVPVDDSIDDEAETVIINLATGADYIPDTTSNTATLTITDDDTAGITVTPQSLTTTEAGGTATFTVVLDSQPTADVTINLTSDNTAEGTIDLSTLTFTSLNWNTAQTVTVTGVNDNIDDGDIAYNIVTAATSTDTTYNGFNVPDVAVTNTDDDTGGGVSITPTSINVTEGAATASYDIVLTIAPTAPVTINFTPDSQINPIQPINFDSSNWNVPQTVTVTAVDDGVVEGLHPGSITHSAVSTDTGYSGIVIDAVTASITDNDTVGVSVMQPVNRTDVIEGDNSDIFKLVLSSQPTADVTIAITTDTQTTTNVPQVIFTPTNWNLPQTVAVTAVDDTVVEGLQSSTISFAAASDDGFYNGFAISPLTVNVSDNDRDSQVINLPAAAFQSFGDGDDVINAASSGDIVYGGAGNDIIDDAGGDDFLYGQLGDDIIDGGDGQDFIWAGAGNDHVKGAGGNDVIFAGDGSDRLSGGAGNDELFGDAGNDHLYGDAGVDSLTGGLGRDAFAVANGTGGATIATADIITDFTPGEDVIDLVYPLGFADISTVQNGADTVIQNQLTGEYLAVLLGITAADIGESDFS